MSARQHHERAGYRSIPSLLSATALAPPISHYINQRINFSSVHELQSNTTVTYETLANYHVKLGKQIEHMMFATQNHTKWEYRNGEGQEANLLGEVQRIRIMAPGKRTLFLKGRIPSLPGSSTDSPICFRLCNSGEQNKQAKEKCEFAVLIRS